MRTRNYYIYREDVDVLKTLAEEYQSMGRDIKIEGNRLTVFARKIVKPVAKKVDRKRRDDVESPERSREQRPKRKD
jgi:hypothetical protein